MQFFSKILFAIFLVSSLGIAGCEQLKHDKNLTEPQLDPKTNVATKETVDAYKSLGKGKGSFAVGDKEALMYDIQVKIPQQKEHPVFWDSMGDSPALIVDWSDGERSGYNFSMYQKENGGYIIDYDKSLEKPDRFHGRWKLSAQTKMEWEIKGDDIIIISANGNKTVLGGSAELLNLEIQKAEQVVAAREEANERRRKELLAKQEKIRKERLVYSDMQLSDLFDIWQQNRLRALKKYNNKEVTVRGWIDGIYEDKFEVKQGDGAAVLQVSYGYSDQINQWLMQRNKGDLVTVTTVLDIEGAFGLPIITNKGRFTYSSGHTALE